MASRLLPQRAVLWLLMGLLTGSEAPAQAGPALAELRPAVLQERLDAALAAKGPRYNPRTEHRLADGRPRFTNRLILEDSPYLLQHAHNPVDWYPWAPEAFARARREGKLVFLSIGYSTCHWCHVMERESFEDLAIAELLNTYFVAIKLDREVRPDLDQVYMTALQLLRRRGGWPLSAILTADGEPILADTYLPPARFADWLRHIQSRWAEAPERVQAQASRVAGAVNRVMTAEARAAELDDTVTARAVAALLASFDALQGGFGPAPKFPREPQLALLLDQAQGSAYRADARAALDAAVYTLRAMARGGIHDQVGGGFHRYAIDNDWLVPHFEKMLYNQAQLARLYLAAWRLTGDPSLARVARRTLDFVLRDLTSPEGGFYSATDADSEGEEGRFFVWTRAELDDLLGPDDAELAAAVYGVTGAGNFEGRNILHLPLALDAAAAEQGLTPERLRQRVDAINAALLQARAARPHPHRDDKILTAWNGMMIAALAEAGDSLWEPKYLRAAERAAALLWTRARAAPGALERVYYGGRTAEAGLLSDYAFLGLGLVALYDATAEPEWLARARELADALWQRFADPEGGGLFMAEPRAGEPAMARPKDLGDGAIPSGTAAALHLLAALARRTDELAYEQQARTLVATASGQVLRVPEAFPTLLTGLGRLRHGETGPRQYAARGAVRVDARLRRAGGALTLALDLDMAPGWHINAAQPLQDDLIPTRLGLAGDRPAWRIEDTRYPPAQDIQLGFQREPLSVYAGRVRIEASLTPAAVAPERPALWLPAELRLQACSDDRCLPPETLKLAVPLPQAPGSD